MSGGESSSQPPSDIASSDLLDLRHYGVDWDVWLPAPAPGYIEPEGQPEEEWVDDVVRAVWSHQNATPDDLERTRLFLLEVGRRDYPPEPTFYVTKHCTCPPPWTSPSR